jgi:hypothetical protein
MSPAIADNLLAAVYVAFGAGENHARPKAGVAVHPRNSQKGLHHSYPGWQPTLPRYFDSLAGWFPGHSAH